MALVVVPGAKPHYVLWCCRNVAQRALFDLVTLSVMDGGLVPRPHVLELLFRKQFGCLLGCCPVEPADQVLAVFPAGKADWYVVVGLHDGVSVRPYVCIDVM